MSKGEIIIKFRPMFEHTEINGHLHERDRRRAIKILESLEMDFEGDFEDGCTECQRLEEEVEK